MENITIPMEEYKELLIIKGKYEELKMHTRIIDCDKISGDVPIMEYPYRVYCTGD